MKFVTTSWDDGHVLDFKLASLLHKYKLAGTFYIPQKNAEHAVMHSRQVTELGQQFEVGGHTINHTRLYTTDKKTLEYEIGGSYLWLSDLLGYEPQSFCFPGGVYHKKAIEVTFDTGYKVARTTELLSTKMSLPNGLTPTTLQVYEHSAFTYAKHLVKRRRFANLVQWLKGYSLQKLPAVAESYLNLVNKNGGCFHLWGHSWEIEEFGLWNKLEELLRIISSREDFIYISNKEIANTQLHSTLTNPI